jgi:hypothetical protein
MANVSYRFPQEEVRAHRRTFVGFERLVLFAALHVALALSCLAVAFLGHAPAFALLLGLGGSMVMIAAFVLNSPHD